MYRNGTMAQPMKNGMRQPQLEAASGAIQLAIA
jgi:hypothetical protein